MFKIISRLLDWLRILLWKNEMEITIVGLQQAGKSTLVNILSKAQHIDTIPTIGFNARTVTYGRTVIRMWDLGGERRFRGMWERYCRGVHAILYMVDAADLEALKESTKELHCLQKKTQLMHIPILVLGNKIDLPNALSESDFIEQMELENIENRQVCCYMISCINKENIEMVLQWLLKHAPST